MKVLKKLKGSFIGSDSVESSLPSNGPTNELPKGIKKFKKKQP